MQTEDSRRHTQIAIWLVTAALMLNLSAYPAVAQSFLVEDLSSAEAEETLPTEEQTDPVAQDYPFTVYPSVTLEELQLDEDGYAINGEYVYYNEEDGEYRYISPTLNVHIIRHQDTSPRVVWHEAQIYSRDGTLFHMYPYDEANWMKKGAHQTMIAQKNHLVFAVNSDFSHLRVGWKATVGLLIRNGTIISDHTFTKKAKKYPNLDNLALLPDGSMLASGRNELTIDDYIAMGAYDLLAFGPVLIHNGEINTPAFGKYGWERAPRTAIGMVTPGHYVAIMVEGRHDESRGWSTTHMAEHMAELGATEALNLDGGQSATMIFMGKQIIRVGQSESLKAKPRKSTEVLGIGQSIQVQLPEE
ncbi:MAG: phosphodiester glycosidase family protein [Eubacteriales bacterium]|nr:phosphodiester glycosidase family protein [Eubacteriales bacterium]